MAAEKVRAQIWARATDDERLNIQLILGDEQFSIDMDLEDAKSWSMAIEKAVQDVVRRLPVVDV